MFSPDCLLAKRPEVSNGGMPRPTWRARQRLALLADDVVLWAIRELGNVLRTLLVDDQDIVLAVTARARQTFRQHNHRLDGYHHAWLNNRVDVFTQLQAGFATVVVTEGAEGVAVAEGAVLQQVVLEEDLVQFEGDIAAAHTRLDQLETGLVHFDVDFPQTQVLVGAMIEEQGAFQCGVVTGDHREAVQTEDVAFVHLAAGHRVVRAVGVDAGLEPGPGVHQLAFGEGARDLANHRLGGVQRYFVFRHLVTQCLNYRSAADVGNTCAVTNDRVLFGGLDQAHLHAGRGDVDQLGGRIARGQLVAVLQVQVIELDADTPGLRQRLLDGDEEVVALPVGVDDVVGANGTAPRLTTVDIGSNGHDRVLGHHRGIGTTERAVDEIGVIVDVVVGGEDRRVDVFCRHMGAQLGLASGVFLRRES